MALFWQVVTLLSVWLLYGFAASLFVKGSNKRDYLLLISSGLLGGLIGGRIGNLMDITQKALHPEGPKGEEISKQEKDKIFNAISEVEEKIAKLKLSIK